MLSPPSTPAGPSTQDDLARLLELAGSPVRPAQSASAEAEMAAAAAASSRDFAPRASLTPSLAREAACHAEAGTMPPCTGEAVAACKPGAAAVLSAAAVVGAHGVRRFEEEPVAQGEGRRASDALLRGEGRPHPPSEYRPGDPRRLCAAACSAVLQTTSQKQPVLTLTRTRTRTRTRILTRTRTRILTNSSPNPNPYP